MLFGILRLGRGFVLLVYLSIFVRIWKELGIGRRGGEGREGIRDCACVGPEAWCGAL